MADIFISDITGGEMKRLLASIVGFPADQVGGWLLVVRQTCGADDCVGFGCEAGLLAVLNAAQVEGNMAESYSLHMAADLIEGLAIAQRDRK